MKTKTTPEVKAPTLSFEFTQSDTDPKVYTAVYYRDGVETDRINNSSYIMCAAVMERRMRLAMFE